MTDERAAGLATFLDRAGWAKADIANLAGDASNRRYLRLKLDGRPAVLMDAPPEKGEDCRPFVAMTTWLRDHGYSAPEVLAADLNQGFLLLEDLGDDLFARHLQHTPEQEQGLYTQAVLLLAQLGQATPPAIVPIAGSDWALPPYDQPTLDRETALLTEWWMPLARGKVVHSDLVKEFADLVRAATAGVADARKAVVLRDYHAENLLWLPGREGLARVGLLDYQDALVGHPAYDLVSLLEDARRDTSAELREAMIKTYLEERPDLDAEEFRHAYAVLGAQRNLKIVGIFARLAKRDAKPGYLKLIPRVWNHLMNDLTHPALAALASWVGTHVPAPVAETLARAEATTEAAG